MAKNSFKNKKNNFYPFLYRQKQTILNSFDVESCNIINCKKLECVGRIRPTDVSPEYKFKLYYNPPGVPKVYIVEPIIEYDFKIHMFSDKRLCLYFPIEQPWKHTHNIYSTIIPWITEWLIFYEYYQLTGVWKGKSKVHINEKIDN